MGCRITPGSAPRWVGIVGLPIPDHEILSSSELDHGCSIPPSSGV
jgi:hypothetical protein